MKRYLTDPYQKDFQTTILSCKPLTGGRFAVTLAETCFYPESGGQLPDRGTINGIEVLDVREMEDGTVLHELAGPVEGPAAGQLDWSIRFDHMQHHTGQHILTRAFIETTGMHTVGFHMGSDGCTIDLEGRDPGELAIDAAEVLANRIIWENRPITVRTVPVEEIKKLEPRKTLPDGVAEARLVGIRDFDLVACCGTHVSRTGEVGLIKVLRSEKAKNNTRVHFKAGRVAFEDFREKHEVVKQLANRFTTAVDGVLAKTDKLSRDVQQLRREMKKNSQKLVAYEKTSLLNQAMEIGGLKAVVHLCDQDDDGYLNMLAAALKKESGTLVLLGSPGGRIILSAPPDLPFDPAAALVELARQAGGNGGGQKGSARVQLPAKTDIKTFLEKVFDHVKNSV